MKIKLFFFFSGLLLLGWSLFSCCGTQCNQNETNADVILQDYGAEPTVINIEDFTLFNDNFRIALWTGTYLQLTLMAIPVGGEIGLERHCDTDQFLRIEEGEGKVLMGDTEESLTFEQTAGKDFVVFVPAGKWHNLINTGNVPLKLYSIYAPTEHPKGTVHKTCEETEEAEHQH